eukprot:m.174988 g.174988  ORF g.174988 m.174988 type:complete len:528 (+) comp13909_c0_seq1:88-1671(+)
MYRLVAQWRVGSAIHNAPCTAVIRAQTAHARTLHTGQLMLGIRLHSEGPGRASRSQHTLPHALQHVDRCGIKSQHVKSCRRRRGMASSAGDANYPLPTPHHTASSTALSSQRPLLHHLRNRIHDVGPLTVADCMREALTNPLGGYYMKGGMIGASGDFVTSPEISQMFGELIGVWHVAQWMAAGQPDRVHLVELGPGKGTMMSDMLRAMSQFPMLQHVSVHLVEASPELRATQRATLCDTPTPAHKPPPAKSVPESDTPHTTLAGPDVTWYDDLVGVADDPDSYTMLVAHEFFDALPIHQFEACDGQWHERLVGITSHQAQSVLVPGQTAPTEQPASNELCFTRAPTKTAAHRLADALGHLPLNPPPTDGTCVEVCLDAVRVCTEIRRRLGAGRGGTALVIDYGDTDVKKETLRAFRNHKEVGVLEDPGSADLTSDVNFTHLARLFQTAHPELTPLPMLGPVTQKQFLHAMAIGARANVLCKSASPSVANDIKLQVHKLVEDMGTRFKFAAVVANQPAGSAVPVFQA